MRNISKNACCNFRPKIVLYENWTCPFFLPSSLLTTHHLRTQDTHSNLSRLKEHQSLSCNSRSEISQKSPTWLANSAIGTQIYTSEFRISIDSFNNSEACWFRCFLQKLGCRGSHPKLSNMGNLLKYRIAAH